MKTPPISIKDIAKQLKVSASTVSRALNDHPEINVKTKKKVMAYARKVGYRPNILALSLKSKRTYTIGLIIPEITHHFFSSVISGVEEMAYGNGYRVMICQTSENKSREEINIQALLDHRVDGVLVSVSKDTYDVNHFSRAFENNIPVVFYDRISDDMVTDRVITDDYEGSRSAVKHLIERGSHNILHLAAPKHLLVGKERHRGYVKALEEHNISYTEKLVLLCDTSREVNKSRDHILKLIRNGVNGIFAVNDFTAIAVMQLLQAEGYKIPADVAIAGFGDDPIATIVNPALTTVEQKGYAMGKESVKLLIERIEKPDEIIPPRIKVFESKLKIRAST